MDKEGYDHVLEGYVRVTDVLFKWHTVLNPWHVSGESIDSSVLDHVC